MGLSSSVKELGIPVRLYIVLRISYHMLFGHWVVGLVFMLTSDLTDDIPCRFGLDIVLF